MEPILLRILNEEFDTVAVIDTFSDLAWRERFYEAGDVEFTVPPDSPYVKYLQVDNYVYRTGSRKLMVIEKIITTESPKNGNTVKVVGRSLESILDRRIVWDKTTITGNLQEGIKRVINAAFVSPNIPARAIANFSIRSSEDSRVTALTVDAAEYEGDSVYDVVVNLCKDKKVGFEILPDWEKKGFIFGLYMGVNRSYSQDTEPWVVFSPMTQNLLEGRFVETRENVKTAALVTSSDGSVREEVISKDLAFTSLQRREIYLRSDVENKQPNKDDFGKAEELIDKEKYGIYNWNVTPENQREYEAAVRSGRSVKRSDYGTVSWEVDASQDPNYQAALAQAQTNINIAYANAAAAATEVTKSSLQTKGQEELAKYGKIKVFDGDLENTKQYVFERDFFVGDTVQVRDRYGHEGVCLVIEMMLCQDDNGTSLTPTFESE